MGGLGFDSGGGGTAYDSKTQQYFYTVSPKNSFSGGKEGRGSNCCSRPRIVGIYMLCLIVAHGQGRGRGARGVGCGRPGQHSQTSGKLGDKTNILNKKYIFNNSTNLKLLSWKANK